MLQLVVTLLQLAVAEIKPALTSKVLYIRN
jgi:hypothetical protein